MLIVKVLNRMLGSLSVHKLQTEQIKARKRYIVTLERSVKAAEDAEASLAVVVQLAGSHLKVAGDAKANAQKLIERA